MACPAACYIQINTRMRFLFIVGTVLSLINVLTVVSLHLKGTDESSKYWKLTSLSSNLFMVIFGATSVAVSYVFRGAPDGLKMRLRSAVLAFWIVMILFELSWIDLEIEKGGLISESFSNQPFLQRKVP